MGKSALRRKYKQLQRRYREDLTQATAYLVHRIEDGDRENADLRARCKGLKDDLMAMTVRLAAAQGYTAAIEAGARGESGCVAVPVMVADSVVTSHRWWN